MAAMGSDSIEPIAMYQYTVGLQSKLTLLALFFNLFRSSFSVSFFTQTAVRPLLLIDGPSCLTYLYMIVFRTTETILGRKDSSEISPSNKW